MHVAQCRYPHCQTTGGCRDACSKIARLPARTYAAKAFCAAGFQISGTLDGFIDFATSLGTWQITLDEARALIAAINGAMSDVQANCLYDRDALLEPNA